MSTEFFNDQWRIPSNENQNKISNYSMEFDGANYVQIGPPPNNAFLQPSEAELNANGFSVSAWIKIDSSFVSNGGIFTNDGIPQTGRVYGIEFRLNSDRTLRIDKGDGTGRFGSDLRQATTTETVSLDTWTHVAFVLPSATNTTWQIYINGVASTMTTGGSGGAVGYSSAYSGGIGRYRFNYFVGQIDQVTVFDSALSQDQVTQLGAEGYAFNFNGSTQAVDCGTGSRFNIDQITISAWVRLESGVTDLQMIGGVRNTNNGIIPYMLSQHTNSKFRFLVNQSSDSAYKLVYANDDTVLNTWYHVVGVADGSNVKLYINGILQTDQTTYDGTITSPTRNFNIGRQPSLAAYYLDGELSNISVFNTGLSSTDVQTLYNNGAPNDISSLSPVGWWKLDNTATFNSGTSVWTIPDDSSNSNTGSSVGMTSSSLVASNINGELIANPMITSPKPIAYYQLGDQSVYNGANLLVPNNSLSDYVFNIDSSNANYIDLGTNPFSFTQNLTVSFWIKSTQTALNTFIGKDVNGTSTRNWMVMLYQNKVYFWTTSTGSISNLKDIQSNVAGVVSDGKWHHIVCVNNQTNVTKQIYIDGVLDVTNSNGGLISTSSSPVQIGRRPNGSPYDGEMSNVALWDTAFTGPQVETLYNNGAPNDISSLSPVAWYKLNAADTFDSSTSTWTITDYGSGGNDGTSFNMNSANLVVSDLQQTSGYSPYALDFDGINDYLDCGNDSSLQITGAMTISYWVKGTSTFGASGVGTLESSTSPGYLLGPSTTNTISFNIGLTSSSLFNVSTTQQITTTEWHHIVGVYTPSVSIKIYIDGQLSKTETSNIPSSQYAGGNDFRIGYRTCCQIDGQISNVAIWNTDLSSSEINEIYNEGVPSNLNNFSGTAPVSWWQIGSNSSFNTNWTCLDEIGTNNAVSSGSMTNDDIVDGIGYSASGVGTSSIDIKGDAPYSTANGLSENMDVLDRTTDVPS